MKIIRETKSVCPVCITDLDASIIEEENKIYMVKKCSRHGRFKILISADSYFYKQLNRIYLILYRNKPLKIPKTMYQLFLNYKCNLDCSICYVNANNQKYDEPNLNFIKDTIKDWINVEIALFGGEPTLRKDLPEIIKCVEDTNNVPYLVTNGIKLANLDYLRKIKSKRLTVLFQFDGFRDEIYKVLRGESLIEKKRQALNNLNKLDIPTTLEVAVTKHVNEDQLEPILKFAVNNGFIKQVCYRSYAHLGKKGLNYKDALTHDHLIKILEEQTERKVSKKDVLNFQKLVYFLKMNLSFLPIYPCLYASQYLLYRNKGNYKPISELIPLDIIQKNIDSYFHLIGKGKKFKSFFISAKIFLKMVKISNLLLILNFLTSILKKRFAKSRFMLNNLEGWLLLRFSIFCEPSTFDYSVAGNCMLGEIKTNDGVKHNRGICNIVREKGFVKKKL
ncbi:MAG: radical SAM protein [Nanoarchaeota archaeon]